MIYLICQLLDVWEIQVVLSSIELDVKIVVKEESLQFQYRFGLLIYVL